MSGTRSSNFPSGARTIQPICGANPVHVDALVLRQIQRLRPRVVLDVGCATGRFARLLRGCRVVGIELDPVLGAEAAQWCAEVIQGDIEERGTQQKASAEGPYDLVLLLDVLEHLVDPERALESLATLMHSNGRILVSVPNLLYYRHRIHLAAGKFETVTEGGLYDRTHRRFFSYRELRGVVQRAGLEIESLTGAPNVRRGGRITHWPAPLPWCYRTASKGIHAMARARPQLLAVSFIAVLRRPSVTP